jgi:hypothetical protein
VSSPDSFEKPRGRVDRMKRRARAAAGKTVKAWSRRSLNLKRPTAPKTTAAHGPASKEAEVARRTRATKSLRLRVCAKVAQRPVDFLAIFVAGVASIAVIVNAVFLQSGPRIYEPEQLFSKLQRTHESLKSENERLRHKIDSASTGVEIMATRSGSWRGY